MLGFVHSRLSLGARIFLLGGLVLAPLVLLAALFVGQSWKDIDFAHRESAGADYLSAVWPVIIESARDQPADAALETLKAASRRHARLLSVNAAPVLEAPTRETRLEAAVALVGRIADASNLTLDPDLDSFYVMDAVTVKLPALTAAVADRAAAPAVRAERLRAASEGAQTDLATAMTDNAAGLTRRVLAGGTRALGADAETLSAAWAANPDGGVAEARGLLRTADGVWKSANAELLRLLRAREAGLQQRLVANLGLALLFSALAGALGWAIVRALERRMRDLVAAMERVSSGDLGGEIPHLTDRNETGRLAAGIELFRGALARQAQLEAAAETERNAAEAVRARAEAERREAAEAQAAVVETLARELSLVASGDLTRRISSPFPPAYEALRADFNTAVQDLDDAVCAISASIRGIQGATHEISSASADLSRRTESQAATLEETAAVIDELTATVQKTSDGAREAASVAGRSRRQADGSGPVVQQAIEAMTAIQSSSDAISRIVGMIDEIAFQTNLLALNAGVEAARAGDAGKGFAVVAQEVRALSQRSAEAAREIAQLVRLSAAEVGRGVEMAGRTGAVIGELAADVAGIDGLIQSFSTAAQEQAQALRQASQAVNQMDQVTQQNAAMVEQTTAATQALLQDVHALSGLAGRFRVTSNPQGTARAA